MATHDIFSVLSKHKIRLFIEGNELVTDYAGTFPPEVAEILVTHHGELMRWLQARQAATPGADIPLAPVSRQQPLRPSAGQCFSFQYEKKFPQAAHIHVEWRIDGALDVALLETAINALIQRHEILRTVFRESTQGEPVLVIQEPYTVKLPAYALCATTQAALRQEIEQLAFDIGRQPYDLQTGPLFRFALAQWPDGRQALFLAVHHIIIDGRSITLLINELGALYEAAVRGTRPALRPLPVQYADYAQWEHTWLHSEAYRQRLPFWEKQLSPFPLPLALPYDRPPTPATGNRGAWERITVPAALTAQLHTLARQQGVSLYVLLLAAFTVLLRRVTGQTDITIGVLAANRPRRELSHMIGLFVNTLLLRSTLTADKPVLKHLSELHALTLDATHRYPVPVHVLEHVLPVTGEHSYAALYKVIFGFKNYNSEPFMMGGRQVSRLIRHPPDVARGNLICQIENLDDHLVGRFEYNLELFNPSTIKQFKHDYLWILRAIVEHPDHTLAALCVASD